MYILESEKDTTKLAQEIAKELAFSPGIVFLEGSLGVGKTFICKEIIRYLSENTIIAGSPTFNIMKQYDLENFSIYHLDLYRIQNEEELLELGVQELENSIILVEWPEIASNILIPDITLKLSIVEETRRCKIIRSTTETVD